MAKVGSPFSSTPITLSACDLKNLFKRFAHSARPGKVNWRKSITAFYVSFFIGGLGWNSWYGRFVFICRFSDLFGSVHLFSSGCFGLRAAVLVVR